MEHSLTCSDPVIAVGTIGLNPYSNGTLSDKMSFASLGTTLTS